MKLNLLTKNRSAFNRVLAIALFSSFSLAAYGGKGGTKGKPGGGGDNGGGGDPPQIEVPELAVDSPISYTLTTYDGITDASPSVPWAVANRVNLLLEDINKDGIACGVVAVTDNESSIAGNMYGIVASESGGVQALDDLFSEALKAPDFQGLRIRGAHEINGDGQIACVLTANASGDFPIAIADLRDSSLMIVNSVTPSTYGFPGGGPIRDLNEKGDVLSYEGYYTGKGRRQQYVSTYWLSLTNGLGGWNSSVSLSGIGSAWRLNTTPEQLAYFSTDMMIYRRDLSTTNDLLVDDLSSLDSMYSLQLHVADDGDVYFLKSVDSNDGLQGYPVRWVKGQGLQALRELQNPSRGPLATVLDVSKSLDGVETVEVLLGPTASPDFDLEIYHPDGGLGTRYPVIVTNSGPDDVPSYRPTAIGRPDASAHGHICGWANKNDNSKGGFILTPVIAP